MKNIKRTNLRALTSSVALILGSSGVHATCLGGTVVTTCADSGVGSLRSVIGCANDGNVVDMSKLTCGDISLTTGEIVVPQNNLQLKGLRTVITGEFNGNNRLFNHIGTGQLAINSMLITDGHYKKNAPSGKFYGGCIASQGYVHLLNSTVSACSIDVTGGAASAGGGIFAKSGIYLSYSSVSGNSANAASGALASGGGLETFGYANIYLSTIANNAAFNAGGLAVVTSTDYVAIGNSTISGNFATQNAGGALLTAKGVTVSNSTISGNYAPSTAGGLVVGATTLQLSNSTIAFNVQKNAGAGTSGGLNFSSGTLQLQSTIISNNTVAGEANDLYVGPNVSFTGNANLVFALAPDQGTPAPANFGLPAGTCPLLLPLSNNGETLGVQTHSLASGSPALAKGNNSKNLGFDERGPGFPRTSNGAFGLVFTDIGAYELQRADIVFNAGFDGCP